MSEPPDESAEILKKILALLEDRLPDESAEILKKILALLEDRLPCAKMPTSPEPSGKKRGGRPPLDWETMFMWTAKGLLKHGTPQKAEELIERMRDACRTAGINVPAVSTLEPTAYKWMRILRDD